jgi:hypothetical protein
MKHQYFRRLYIFPALAGMLLLSGCPYSSPYRLDNEPQLTIEKELLGKWAAMTETKRGMQPVKLILSEKNNMEYDLAITGYIDDLRPYVAMPGDTIKGTAFTSMINNTTFLNIAISGQTYISKLTYLDNKLSILPLAEHFTAKYIKSGMQLRTAVEFHFNTRLKPIYDQSFCLKDMVRVN